jgi:hypothetical protein
MFPDLDLTGFEATAGLDYVKFLTPVHGSHYRNYLSQKVNIDSKPASNGFYTGTLHDPTAKDLNTLESLDNPSLAGVEIFIDFWLNDKAIPNRIEQLERCFLALAARLRTDDRHPTGAGYKCAFGSKSHPPNTHLALASETIVIGHRSTGVNFRMYFKKMDQYKALPDSEWRVRMEIFISGLGLAMFNLHRVSDLRDYKYRRTFAKHFKIVDRVSVRTRADWSETFRKDAQKKLDRRWPQVGVHAIAPIRYPDDASEVTLQAGRYRERPGRHQVLPAKAYKFHVHAEAHKLIADALRSLERKLATKRNSGRITGASHKEVNAD